MSRILDAAAGTIGLIAIGFALAAAIAPGELESIVPIRTAPISEGLARAIAFATVGALCAVWVAWTSGTDRSEELSEEALFTTDVEFRTLREDPPEDVDAKAVVGEAFDSALAVAARDATNGDEDDPLRDEIRSLAVAVVAHTEDCSEAEAESIVDAGEWTDDTVAAAYVADSEATLSLRYRLLAWLRPARTKRSRIDRSIRAIDRIERGFE